jgi:hypothetical protein
MKTKNIQTCYANVLYACGSETVQPSAVLFRRVFGEQKCRIYVRSLLPIFVGKAFDPGP